MRTYVGLHEAHMFAYGKTVLCVQVYCEPDVQDDGDDDAIGQTASLVKDLTSANTNSRPSSKHVIEGSSFFAILKEVRMKVPSVCLLCEMMG